jgi:hypothetical protein
MSYVDISFEIISKFVGPDEIAPGDLKALLKNSYATFDAPGNMLLNYIIILLISEEIIIVIRIITYAVSSTLRGDAMCESARVLGTGAIPRTNICIQRRGDAILGQPL